MASDEPAYFPRQATYREWAIFRPCSRSEVPRNCRVQALASTRHNSSIHIGGTGGEGALAGAVGLAKKVALGDPIARATAGGGLLHGVSPRCALGPGDGLWRGFWLCTREVAMCGCRRSGWAQHLRACP